MYAIDKNNELLYKNVSYTSQFRYSCIWEKSAQTYAVFNMNRFFNFVIQICDILFDAASR